MTMFRNNHKAEWALKLNLATQAGCPVVSVCVCERGRLLTAFHFKTEEIGEKRKWVSKDMIQVHEQFHSINNSNLAYSWLQYERGHAGVWVSARGQPEWVWHQCSGSERIFSTRGPEWGGFARLLVNWSVHGFEPNSRAASAHKDDIQTQSEK